MGYDTGAAADADNDTGSLSGGTEQSISLNTEDEAAAAAAAGSGIDLYRVGVMAPEDNASDDGAPETIGGCDCSRFTGVADLTLPTSIAQVSPIWARMQRLVCLTHRC